MKIFPCPAPPHPARVFPTPQRWWGGDEAIFCPRTPGRGGDGFSILSPPCPIPATPRPCPALIRTIIVNLVNPKSLIFKVKHMTLDKIFFYSKPTAIAANPSPFSIAYARFSILSQTPLQVSKSKTLLFTF